MLQETFKLSYDVEVTKNPLDPSRLIIRPKVTALLENPMLRLPQHIIFLIDRSGSMQGENIIAVKNATIKLINEFLKPEDSFSVVVFDKNADVIVNNFQKDWPS